MKKVKNVKFHCPSNWTLVAKFKYVSTVGHTIERCWLFISHDSDSVWLAYTFYNKSDISYKCLGAVGDFPTLLAMLSKGIFISKSLSHAKTDLFV